MLGSWRMARVQSENFGREVKGLRRSTQWRLSLEIEVRLEGCGIERLGGGVWGWDIGDAEALRRKVFVRKRRRKIPKIIFPLVCMSTHQNDA